MMGDNMCAACFCWVCFWRREVEDSTPRWSIFCRTFFGNGAGISTALVARERLFSEPSDFATIFIGGSSVLVALFRYLQNLVGL